MSVTHEEKPSAWLVPTLVDFTDANKVHFSRAEGCAKSDDELKDLMAGTVLWSPEIFCDSDDYVVDKNGVKHYPEPLFRKIKT